jgi:hypothetical protein
MSQSPFKFLDAYQKEDADRFFGRERETAQLYNAVHASNLVLLYGASGTGKTSIINCGLGNKFVDSDWLPLYVRRGTDLNRSLDRELAGAMKGDGPAADAPISTSSRSSSSWAIVRSRCASTRRCATSWAAPRPAR